MTAARYDLMGILVVRKLRSRDDAADGGGRQRVENRREAAEIPLPLRR